MSNRVISTCSSPNSADLRLLSQIETKAREQGVFVVRDAQSVTINGPVALGVMGKCSKCKRGTADGNCYGYALCECGSWRR